MGIEVEGFVIPETAFNPALELLAQLIGVRIGEIKTALASKPDYQTIWVPKGKSRTKKRRLDIPPEPLKQVQKRLLRNCLYHIVPTAPGWTAITGFRKGASIRENAARHLIGNAFFQFDLKDAFPSVTEDILRQALEALFDKMTIKRMFRFKDVRWFYAQWVRYRRKKKRDPKGQRFFPFFADPVTMLWAFREIIIWLTIYEGSLPQGAPTSPFLLNLVLNAFGIPAKIIAYLEQYACDGIWFRVTVYADDVTISTPADYIPEEVREGVIRVVETETPFKINPQKTRYTVRRQRSPHITGLSFAHKRQGLDNVTVPKKLQRKARGLIHRAIFEPELRAEALGMVAFLLDVYKCPDFLPNQIKGPYERLLATIRDEQDFEEERLQDIVRET